MAARQLTIWVGSHLNAGALHAPLCRAFTIARPALLTSLLSLLAQCLVSVALAQSPVTIRINAGGDAYTDSNGNVWSADRAYNTGVAAVAPAGLAIDRTEDDALYRTDRFDFEDGEELAYSFRVPSGFYEVKLHFAEWWPNAFAEGARVSDVEIENSRMIQGLDVYALGNL